MKQNLFAGIKKILILIILIILEKTSFAQNLFLDEPIPLTQKETYFPQVVQNKNKAFLFYEKKEKSSLYIEFLSKDDKSTQWNQKKVVAGPVYFTGDIPHIYSVFVKDDMIVLAVSLSANELGIYFSEDDGSSFQFSRIYSATQNFVAPRLFSNSKGEIVLFVSSGMNEKFSILYSKSSDAKNWSEFEILEPTANFDNSFSPYLLPFEDGDLILFQSHFSYPGKAKTFQIYSTFYSAENNSFLTPTLITDDFLTQNEKFNSFLEYSNQNPVAFTFEDETYLAFERTKVNEEDSTICVTKISKNGIEKSNNLKEFYDFSNSHAPYFYVFQNNLNLLWFDEFTGILNSTLIEKKQFSSPQIFENSSSSVFAFPVIFDSQKRISFIWQKNSEQSRIFVLNQDCFVEKPKLKAVNFEENIASTKENVKIQLEIPYDKNGISGFSWIFTDDKNENVPKDEISLVTDGDFSSGKRITINAKGKNEGNYYFKCRVQDNGKNWSDESVLKYERDITPPKKVILSNTKKDSSGFEYSNSLDIFWQKNQDDNDVKGYSYNFTKVASLEKEFFYTKQKKYLVSNYALSKKIEEIKKNQEKYFKKASKLPKKIVSFSSSKSYKNLQNGIYVFSVCAIDNAGNVGDAESKLFVLNKYQVNTYISHLKQKKDILGNVEIEIFGNDFEYDGTIEKIYIDKDGIEPFDKILFKENKDFVVESNSKISGINIFDLESSVYGIYIVNENGEVFPKNKNSTQNKIQIEQSGNVVIEHPYSIEKDLNFEIGQPKKNIKIVELLLKCLVVFAFFVSIATIFGIVKIAKEANLIQKEVYALLNGENMPLTEKEKSKINKNHTSSLKVKLVAFSALLVLSIVVMVSVSLGLRMIKTQRETLVESMQKEVLVLMEGMSAGLQNAMSDALSDQGTFGLVEIVRQAETFESAISSTLLGRAKNNKDSNVNYFWATTRKNRDISSKLNSSLPEPGISVFKENTIEVAIAEECKKLEEIAHEKSDSLINELDLQYDAAKKGELTQLLRSLSRNYSSSIPKFAEETLLKDNPYFTFYYPVFYKDSSSNNLLQNVLILEVSAEELILSLQKSKIQIIVISVIIAILAIICGCIGAFILASYIVEPLKRLVSHVKIITETKDKKKLKNFNIKIKSHDEIGTLGLAVNEMTSGLVKAAEDEEKNSEQQKMALDAKSVQQTFLPLSASEKGGKKTTAFLSEKSLNIFGYYEGADEVSGDYFDYKKLDERYYAIIKCDVSGHGVPAALIMTVVATLFRKYFENWSFSKNGTSLDKLIIQINDFIESLGVKGKFATILLCLFDSISGDAYLSNAGDNIIHIYSNEEKKVKTLTLKETPAAGPLPSFMVEMKGGFKVEKIHLNKNDILFLYTDGIEEATRFFRDKDFNIIECQEKGLKDNIHINHKVGEKSEQLENERVIKIIECVLNKEKFVLKKMHFPVESEFVFDFSNLSGSIEDAILALVSVEKVFRIYKSQLSKTEIIQKESGEKILQGDFVKTDRKIDEFLKKTFNFYEKYCLKLADFSTDDYVYYKDVNEDPQADDLTLLAIQKN